MPATPYDIEDLEQGSTFQLDITITDPDTGAAIDLTGYTARAQARLNYADASPAFTFEVSTPSAEGLVTMSLTDEVTAAIAKGSYYYDLELLAPSGTVIKIIKGKAKVTPEATK